MTATITKSISFNLYQKLGLVTLAFCCATALSCSANASVMPKLPILQNAGVVPLVIEEPEGHDPDLAPILERIGESFPEVVRKSRRFRVINDDLVRDLWKDSTGRAELINEFEIQAFVAMTAVPQSDVVSLNARILDPQLQILLQEQDRVPADWLRAASSEAINDKLERLVFALVNRLPVDVSVTSVVGPYITVSGGSEQGLLLGDRLDLQRIRINAIHPANGSWLGFETKTLGSAEVIEVKQYNAVARMTGQSRDRAIEVGDGARIAAIQSRNKFARLAQQEGFKDAGESSANIIPPTYLGESATNKPLINKQAVKLPAATTPVMQVAKHANETKPDHQSGEPIESPNTEVTPATQTAQDDDSDPISFFDRLKSPDNKWLDDIYGYIGPHWWSVRGPANASGKFPIWLLNSVGAGVTRTLFYRLKTAFGGGALFGQTAKGNFVGYDGNARLFWEEPIVAENSWFRFWHLGGYASLSGLSVSKEKFGGGDFLRGGVFAGLGGVIVPSTRSGDAYDWFADLAILPLNIGRFGYSGKQQLVESAFGSRITLGAYLRADSDPVQWGGALDLSDERLTLKNSRRPHMVNYRLKLLAKYSF